MSDAQVAVAVEAKKKAVMDKHLDLIVGQTEKYSKMLASNLAKGAVQSGMHAAVQCTCSTLILT